MARAWQKGLDLVSPSERDVAAISALVAGSKAMSFSPMTRKNVSRFGKLARSGQLTLRQVFIDQCSHSGGSSISRRMRLVSKFVKMPRSSRM